MSRNNSRLSSSSLPTNYSLVNRHIAQKEKSPGDRRLCSSQKPWELSLLDFLSSQTFSLSIPVTEEVWLSRLGSVQFAGLVLLGGMGDGFGPP